MDGAKFYDVEILPTEISPPPFPLRHPYHTAIFAYLPGQEFHFILCITSASFHEFFRNVVHPSAQEMHTCNINEFENPGG